MFNILFLSTCITISHPLLPPSLFFPASPSPSLSFPPFLFSLPSLSLSLPLSLPLTPFSYSSLPPSLFLSFPPSLSPSLAPSCVSLNRLTMSQSLAHEGRSLARRSISDSCSFHSKMWRSWIIHDWGEGLIIGASWIIHELGHMCLSSSYATYYLYIYNIHVQCTCILWCSDRKCVFTCVLMYCPSTFAYFVL